MNVRENQGDGKRPAEAFEFDPDARVVHVTDRELLEGLREFASRVGGRPFSIREFNAWRDRPARGITIVRRFGSWRGALAKVGVKGVRCRECTNEELMDDLERVWRELGRRPGATQVARRGQFSPTPYQRRWGSVERACRRLARYHRGQISRAELLRPDCGRKGGLIRPELRWRILKRDRFRCMACGNCPATDSSIELEVDHIHP